MMKNDIRQDYEKTADKIMFYGYERRVDVLINSVKEFFKKYHQGNIYTQEEAMILYRLNRIRRFYHGKEHQQSSDKIFNLQMDIIQLSEMDDNPKINELCEYWNRLFDRMIDEVTDDFETMQKNFKAPFICLLYLTGVYFLNKHEKTFTPSELYLIDHVYVSFLGEEDPFQKNVFYYVMDQLFESITNNKLINDKSIKVEIDACNECEITFGTVDEFRNDITLCQLMLWKSTRRNKTIEEINEINKVCLEYLSILLKKE